MKSCARHVKIAECQIVEGTIALYERDGKPLPPPTSGRDFANRMQSVA
jgi:hypothetical protein